MTAMRKRQRTGALHDTAALLKGPFTFGHVLECASPLALFLLLGVASASTLEWQSGAGHRSAAVVVPTNGKTGFTRLATSDSGIIFSNHITIERYTTNQIYLNGSGVAAGDLDGDGWCDLFFAGLSGQSRLYRNLGNWKFTDMTSDAGVLHRAGRDRDGARGH